VKKLKRHRVTIDVTYDPEVDAAYLYLVPEGSGKHYRCYTREVTHSINVDIARDDVTLVGIEVYGNASEILSYIMSQIEDKDDSGPD
jgi:uncharacterized protein YuzE